MVVGYKSFKEKFQRFNSQYIIIGGTACDILMGDAGLSFRATKDFDIVIVVDRDSEEFGRALWEYIEEAGYEHRNNSTGEYQFYRFTKPKREGYPKMIELFSKRMEAITLPDNAVLTPVVFGDDISSLSAIILNDDYYNFLLAGMEEVSEVSVLGAAYLIAFKAKAWLDLSERRQNNESVDSKTIKKHQKDVFRLFELLSGNERISAPTSVITDFAVFCEHMRNEEVNLKDLGIGNMTKEEVLTVLRNIYVSEQ